MKGESFLNSKVVVASALTALTMGALGGTAALAGSNKGKSHTAPAPKKAAVKAKKVVVIKPAHKAVTTTPPAPGKAHNDGAEHAAFAAALAAKLGVTSDQVDAALKAIHPADGTRPDPAGFPKALADQLGKSEAEVKAALDALRADGQFGGPGHGHDGHGPGGHGPDGPMAAALASKLGVTTDQLKAAFDAIRPAAGTRPDRGQLPAKLAAQLGKTEAEVKAALDAVRPQGGPEGHGPDGHGPEGHGPDGDGPDGQGPDGDGPPAPPAGQAFRGYR